MRFTRKKNKNVNQNMKNLHRINPSNKIVQAAKLPKVLNLNPRSIYNKIEEFKTFFDEEDIDLVCLSESWERPDLGLKEVIEIENTEIISNPHQRKELCGRPAIVVRKNKFVIEDLTNTQVSIPWGVEIVWALLTPKEVTVNSKVKKIVVGSMYCKPGSRKKTLMLDHIAQVYGQMSAKYTKGLHWILAGDTNELKLDSILHLNSNLKQVVQDPTRLDPPKILDPIITTLADFYQKPVCLPPLQADPNSGVASDHLIVVMEPMNHCNTNNIRSKKEITYRPVTDLGLQKMRLWLQEETWATVTHEESANRKAEVFQSLLLTKYEEYFPEKVCKVSSDSQPVYNNKLLRLKRKKSREYHKHRKSDKWRFLQKVYDEALGDAKQKFYRNKILKLKKADPRKWYSELKKITSFDQHESNEVSVDDLKELSVEKQVELIADKFASVSNEYKS